MVIMYNPEIADLALFKGMEPRQLELLDSMLVSCSYSKGLVIFEQGQPAENLFILISGEVVVHYKPYDGPPLTVARITPGGVFGWSSALGRKAYTSGAVAGCDSRAFCLNGAVLHRFCETFPGEGALLIDRLASVISERLRNTHLEIITILTRGMDMEDDCWRRNENHD